MTPSERRLSASAANPASHSGQLPARDVLPGIPNAAGILVPVLVAQERVGSVSQTADAAAGRLTALDALTHEMGALPVLGGMRK